MKSEANYAQAILFVYSNKLDPCTVKSCFDLSRGLKRYVQTHEIDYHKLDESMLQHYDVIIFQRLGANGIIIEENYMRYMFYLIRRFYYLRKFIYMIDDLVFEDQNELPKKFMRECHAVICPNQVLGKQAMRYNRHVYILRTYIDMKKIMSTDQPDESSRYDIAWVSTGAVGKELIKEVLLDVRKDIDIRMISIGGDANYLSDIRGVTMHQYMPYSDMVGILKNVNILLNPVIINDYFVAPKIEKRSKRSASEFFDCKSEIKYAIAGGTKTAIITSKTAPYLHAIEHEKNGLFVENTINDWAKAIRRLYYHHRLRRRIIKNAYRDVKKNYTLESGAKNAYNIIRQIERGQSH